MPSVSYPTTIHRTDLFSQHWPFFVPIYKTAALLNYIQTLLYFSPIQKKFWPHLIFLLQCITQGGIIRCLKKKKEIWSRRVKHSSFFHTVFFSFPGDFITKSLLFFFTGMLEGKSKKLCVFIALPIWPGAWFCSFHKQRRWCWKEIRFSLKLFASFGARVIHHSKAGLFHHLITSQPGSEVTVCSSALSQDHFSGNWIWMQFWMANSKPRLSISSKQSPEGPIARLPPWGAFRNKCPTPPNNFSDPT